MELYSTTKELLTKQTAIFVQDDDCHYYCIHENELDYFFDLLEESIVSGDNETFLSVFGDNNIGMDPNSFRKEFLK